MSTTEAYISDKGLEGRTPRQIFKGKRRQKVAALHAQGLSHRDIAKKIGISKSTVARDLKWLESSEHQLRAQEVAAEIVEEENFAIDAFRESERDKVVALIAKKHTYEEVAKRLGISVSTVVRHANAYLAEYGDWGGRTMQEWRNEQLISLQQLMHRLEGEMRTQPERATDSAGDVDTGWDLTPYQAAKIRNDAHKAYLQAMNHQARLLQLLVSRTEVDVQQKVMVVKLRNVDLDQFPRQDAPPRIIEG